MIWFQRLFPALMLLWPAVCVTLLPRTGDADRQESRRSRMTVLWVAAAFSVWHR